MKLTNKEYGYISENLSPNTKYKKTLPFSFLTGGAICCLGQAICNIYENLGINENDAGTLTSITLIFLSAIFTGCGMYGRTAKIGGAGTLVPITGFANAVVSPALEFKTEGYILGVGAKMFIIAGPVIVYGLSASVIYGIILYIFQLF